MSGLSATRKQVDAEECAGQVFSEQRVTHSVIRPDEPPQTHD